MDGEAHPYKNHVSAFASVGILKLLTVSSGCLPVGCISTSYLRCNVRSPYSLRQVKNAPNEHRHVPTTTSPRTADQPEKALTTTNYGTCIGLWKGKTLARPRTRVGGARSIAGPVRIKFSFPQCPCCPVVFERATCSDLHRCDGRLDSRRVRALRRNTGWR